MYGYSKIEVYNGDGIYEGYAISLSPLHASAIADALLARDDSRTLVETYLGHEVATAKPVQTTLAEGSLALVQAFWDLGRKPWVQP